MLLVFCLTFYYYVIIFPFIVTKIVARGNTVVMPAQMESQLVTVFQFGVFLYFVKFFLKKDNSSPVELYVSETKLVMEFNLDFFMFSFM